MAVKIPFLVVLLSISITVSSRQPIDFDDIRLDKNGFENTKALHYGWYHNSIKAIMGQLGKDLLRSLNKGDRIAFLNCLDEIPDRQDIMKAAMCLVEARNKCLLYKKQYRMYKSMASSSEPFVVSTSQKAQAAIADSFALLDAVYHKQALKVDYRSSEQRKTDISPSLNRNVRHRNKPKSKNSSQSISYRVKKVKKPLIKKVYFQNEQFLLRRLKRSPYRLTDRISKSDSFKFNVKNVEKIPYLKNVVSKSPIQKVTGMIRKLIGSEEKSNTSWIETYENLLDVKRSMDKRAQDPGAKVYDMRMLDLVVGNRHATASAHDKPFLPPLVQEAYDLMTAIDKSPKSSPGGSNIKFLSPRFAPVMPDRTESRGKLSPSIFPFYRDEAEDQILPIPKILEATGMKEKDRQNIMETVMDISGAKSTVDDALKVLSKMNIFGMEGELKEVTEKIAKNFEDLERSFNRYQRKEIRRKGFTFMEPEQLEKLYEKQGILQRSDVPFDIEEYRTLTRKQREEALWLRIELIAANATNTTEIQQRRLKRQVTWLSVLNPTVLSPYMFSPIYGFTVLGPTVLSPSLFSPLILNPAVLSPYVLAPAVGMPFILSPYLLSPYVLSPLVMAPFILTPYVLSPNVINPYVLSPLILSPLVLCPDVISPMVLGGGILSPAVASPAVFSKSVLMASVLSPSVLS